LVDFYSNLNVPNMVKKISNKTREKVDMAGHGHRHSSDVDTNTNRS